MYMNDHVVNMLELMFPQISVISDIACMVVIHIQYSDLAEAERALILESFRQATIRYQNVIAQSVEDTEIRKGEDKSHMVVVTDTCLPFLASGESSISARVLINYELPTKKVELSSLLRTSYTPCSFIYEYFLLFWPSFLLLVLLSFFHVRSSITSCYTVCRLRR